MNEVGSVYHKSFQIPIGERVSLNSFWKKNFGIEYLNWVKWMLRLPLKSSLGDGVKSTLIEMKGSMSLSVYLPRTR